MSAIKFCYIRNATNVHMRSDGSYSRGNPEAVVVSEVDADEGVIRYAIATAHPTDHFVKSRARHIATERLALVDSILPGFTGPDVDLHRSSVETLQGDPTDRGVLFGENVRNILDMKSGHEITKLIMQEIERLSNLPVKIRKVPRRVGKLATQWLQFASLPKLQRPTAPDANCTVQWVPNEDERPTIPAAPSSMRPEHRDAIPPPPPMPRA